MSLESDTQILTFPAYADYLYLKPVDGSDAVYIRRIMEFRGATPSGHFLVVDDTGRQQLVLKQMVRDFGHAKAWQVVY